MDSCSTGVNTHGCFIPCAAHVTKRVPHMMVRHELWRAACWVLRPTTGPGRVPTAPLPSNPSRMFRAELHHALCCAVCCAVRAGWALQASPTPLQPPSRASTTLEAWQQAQQGCSRCARTGTVIQGCRGFKCQGSPVRIKGQQWCRAAGGAQSIRV